MNHKYPTKPETTTPRFDPNLLDEPEIDKTEPPKYAVIIHNDDHHSQEQVVTILVEVMAFNVKQAVRHMAEAHNTGRSIVALTNFEEAEYYTTKLKDRSLVAEMEKV